MSTGSLDSW